MTTINLNALPRTSAPPEITVYTKASWGDDFVVNDTVLVQESRWSTAPSVSSATLHRRFGSVRMPHQATASALTSVVNRGYYVLIRYALPSQSPIWWLGYADTPITVETYRGGSGGVQEIPCWGFDRALQYATLLTTVHQNPETPDPDPTWLRKDQPSHFNPRRPGNRTQDEVVVAGSGESEVSRYLFCNPSEDEPAFWSTREIFRHLVTFHLPTNDYGMGVIPFAAHSDANDLPDWDQPSLDLTGKTLHDALTELLSEDRMLGWSISPTISQATSQSTPVVDTIAIRPFTRTASALTLPSIGVLPANRNGITWADSTDDLTDGELQIDDSEQVDQVVVRGPREIAIGTFHPSSEWIKDWETTDQTKYKDAYKTHPNWGTFTLLRKRELNDYYRSLPQFRDVYSRYKIRDDWNGRCDGSDSLFLKSFSTEGTPETYVPYLGGVEILDDLPLYRGIDYSGAADQVDESKGRQPMPMFVAVENWWDGTYAPIQDVHTAYGTPAVRNPNRLDYQINVSADNEPGPGFRFSMSGAPQHALHYPFTGNDADPELVNPAIWGKNNITGVVITAAMRGGRRPQWSIPETVSGDLVRRRVITLDHPGLQHIHIAAATAIGVDRDGDLIYSDGGVLRDPMPKIRALCLIAAQNLVEPRRHLQIRTSRMVPAVQPGHIVQTYNGETAGTVVSELRISSPVVEDDSPPPVMMSIVATNIAADLVSLVGRVPQPEPQR